MEVVVPEAGDGSGGRAAGDAVGFGEAEVGVREPARGLQDRARRKRSGDNKDGIASGLRLLMTMLGASLCVPRKHFLSPLSEYRQALLLPRQPAYHCINRATVLVARAKDVKSVCEGAGHRCPATNVLRLLVI